MIVIPLDALTKESKSYPTEENHFGSSNNITLNPGAGVILAELPNNSQSS